MKRRKAFTLIEIMIAIAIVGLIIVGLNTFIFSMGELWGKNSDVRLFDQHVRNVSRYLENELRNASLPPTVATDQAGVVSKEIRTNSGQSDTMLTFELPQGCRLIAWPDRSLPDVVCSLMVRDREGLLLLYQSRLEKRYGADPPRETVITPLVTGMSFDYYEEDFKRWQTETLLRKDNDGKYLVPQRLRLKFAYGTLTREALVSIPISGEGLHPF
jgi:prepilin-type N-terminal cleavage/methylation domain-containing protein